MIEEWREISGYEGLYEVSSLGRVRRLNWRNTGLPRLLYLKNGTHGYKQVELFKHGKGKMLTVHRLVANAFIPNSDNLDTVNHINENKHDNSVSNLEWCSLGDNVRKYYRNHKFVPKFIPRHTTASLKKIVQLSIDGDVIREWDNVATIHRELCFNNWSISQCCDGKRKTAYGFKWQYAV